MRTPQFLSLFAFGIFGACSGACSDDGAGAVDDGWDDWSEGKADDASASSLGAAYGSGGRVRFRLYSARATRVEVSLYAAATGADEVGSYTLTRGGDGVWSVIVSAAELRRIQLASQTIYYGYRVWGPNWPYDPSWTRGSSAGFLSDVDADGNRFNPNKLLLDPYALEVSHDPITPSQLHAAVYASGAAHRAEDSGRVAPKGIVLRASSTSFGTKPTRPFKDEVIYEAHVRGLTMADPSVAEDLRGTYAGAAKKAAYLASLGVTAIELLPLQELQNDQNDVVASTDGDNYWGYMTLAYFAPDRRYAADRSPGGPTRELKQMVRAFHERGIKVYVDVVYNHTGEGGLWDGTGDVAGLLSFRGIDNATYYELASDPRYYYDNTGGGANVNAADGAVRDLIVDSLAYWKDTLGVDGFRFDLAVVLGNTCTTGCFRFDKLDAGNVMNRAVRDLPLRPAEGGAGVDLIAEAWGIGEGTFQLGNFPAGWAEWNGAFRDTVRGAQNKAGIEPITPGHLAARVAGSSDLFADDGRRPWHSINFIAAHDGFTLRDVYSYTTKVNDQPWPYGPSDGGEDNNRSWDQGGDPALQRQAARTGLALVMVAAGVPMITGGDEMYRTQRGNNNAYNVDSELSWLDYADQVTNSGFFDFARRLIAFRARYAALRPAGFAVGQDHDGNGLADITWYRLDGGAADGASMDDRSNHFLAWRLDGEEAGDDVRSIYVAYNGWDRPRPRTCRAPPPAWPGTARATRPRGTRPTATSGTRATRTASTARPTTCTRARCSSSSSAEDGPARGRRGHSLSCW